MSAPSPAPDRPHRRLQGWMLGIVLILLGLAAVLAFLTRGTTDPLGADAPQDVFSATRASAAVADVVATPRVVGSEENARAREDLAAQLMDLGYEIEESEGSATRVRVDDARAGGSRVTNLAASLPGSDPTGTLVLATHIDTVPGSPGAGDAGAGLAVVMETARILAAEDPRNDVLVLIVDGEEEGLRGADAYLRDRAGELLSPVVVLNHEARGVSGRPVIIRTAGPVDTVLTGRPGVEAESFNDALFEIVPNDTDFTRYAEADWWGLDMALIGGAWYYHTPWDDARHLDPSSLQTFGDMTLEHARDLSGRDLGALGDPASTRPVLTTQPWGVLTLPVPVVQVIAVLAVALPLVVLAIQRARGRMTVTGFLTSGLGGVVAIIGAGVAAIALWDAGVATRAGFTSYAVGEPRNPALFVVADALVGLLTVTLVWAALRRILTAVTASHGFVFGAAVLFGAAVAWSPGLLSFMVVPVAAGVFGACLVPFLPESARIPVHGVLLLPVAWMVGTQASLTLEFGVGSGAGLLAVLVTCAMALASPLLTVLASRRLRLVHGLLLPAAAVLAIAGLVLAGTAVSQAIGGPRQVSPQAMLDADSDAVTWSYRGEPNGGRAVLDSLTEQVSHANLPPPELEVLEVQQGQGPDGDRRRVTVELTSPRGGTAFLLTPVANAEDGGGDQERIVLADLRIDGEAAIGEVTGAESVRYVGIPAEESVTVEMTIPDEPLDLVLADETYDLSDLGATITTPDGQLFVEPVVYVRTVVTV